MSSGGHAALKTPDTITPSDVWFMNFLVLPVVMFGMAFAIFSFITAFAITGISWGLLYMNEVFAIDIDANKAAQLFNPFTKKMRSIFTGHQKKFFYERLVPLPKEDPADHSSSTTNSHGHGSTTTPQKVYFTDLRKAIVSLPKKKFESNDGTRELSVSFLIAMMVDTSGTAQEAADKYARFRNIGPQGLMHTVEAEILQLFDSYYSRNEVQALLDAAAVQKAVTAEPEYKVAIEHLEAEYGVGIGVELKKSEPDEHTRKLNEVKARVRNFNDAVDSLKGVPPELRRSTVLMLDPDAKYSEEGYNFNVNAKGLENLRDIMFGGLTPNRNKSQSQKNNPKKGGTP